MKQRILEIRTYKLKPDCHEAFLQEYIDKCVPMLISWPIDLVFFGLSEVDSDSFIAMRAFDSFDERQAKEDAFYSSDQWQSGPRETILSMIENYHDVTITMNSVAIEALRPKTQ